MPYKDNAIGVYLNEKNTSVDWVMLAGLTDFVVIQGTEHNTFTNPLIADHVDQAAKHGLPALITHRFHSDYLLGYDFGVDCWPKENDDTQLKKLKAALANKTFQGVIVEVIDDKRIDDGEQIMPNWVSEPAKVFCGRVQDWLNRTYGEGEKKVYVLTRPSFVTMSSPEMDYWINKYCYIPALFVYRKEHTTMQLLDAVTCLLPADSMKPPTLSCPAWNFWYFYDTTSVASVTVKGITGTIGMFMYNGTTQMMYDALNYNIDIPPDDNGTDDEGSNSVDLTEVITSLDNIEDHLSEMGQQIASLGTMFAQLFELVAQIANLANDWFDNHSWLEKKD